MLRTAIPRRTAKLNRRVTIERRTQGADGAGQPVSSWVTVCTVWANVKGQTGKGAITTPQSGVAESIAKYSVRIRRRDDIDAGMRVVIGGRPWDIRLALPDEETQQWTDIVCEVGGNDG